MDEEVKGWLARIIEEVLERDADQLKWLMAHPEEDDCQQQIAEIERSLEIGRKAAEQFKA